ncbi:hypothetical protein [Borrelia duttonii]|uniref:hypothetical protein n=1 Tax=Borrelia duttonii TaxID=40834 RepID=UPI00059AF48E
MISIKKFFKKIKHQKNNENVFTNSTNNLIIEINPKEIINFCTNYLLISNSTELKAIGILLSSGIPLSQFTKKNLLSLIIHMILLFTHHHPIYKSKIIL